MAFCILKNDHMCKFMGFGLTKYQQEKKRQLIEKYKNIL
jgi:predicted phosphoadenosine phosphosulfate sulfurtransferase